MLVRHEWREYHLTPHGWISGSHEFDGSKMVIMDAPKNRVLTCVYNTYWGEAVQPRYEVKEKWTANKPQLIKDLIAKYGDCPRLI